MRTSEASGSYAHSEASGNLKQGRHEWEINPLYILPTILKRENKAKGEQHQRNTPPYARAFSVPCGCFHKLAVLLVNCSSCSSSAVHAPSIESSFCSACSACSASACFPSALWFSAAFAPCTS